MRPNRPLPTLPFANLPLRRNPNDAAAIIAAKVTRGHCTSVAVLLRAPRFEKCVISAQLILGRVGVHVNGFDARFDARMAQVQSRKISTQDGAKS
jgi:hypothetical protein